MSTSNKPTGSSQHAERRDDSGTIAAAAVDTHPRNSTRSRRPRRGGRVDRQQLSLLDGGYRWRLDDRTRAISRRGIARARAVLAATPNRFADAAEAQPDHQAA